MTSLLMRWRDFRRQKYELPTNDPPLRERTKKQTKRALERRKREADMWARRHNCPNQGKKPGPAPLGRRRSSFDWAVTGPHNDVVCARCRVCGWEAHKKAPSYNGRRATDDELTKLVPAHIIYQ